MGCSPTGYKTFLVVCNIILLFFGFTIMSLGVKMQITLTAFRLGDIPLLINSVKAVTATGLIILATGASGFCGSCYEMLWLLLVHLGGLTLIVIMEFSLGVTLIVLKNTVEAALEETSCGNICSDTVSFIVMKFATPSAGIMMTIIIMEGLMIYSAIQLYLYVRDHPKSPPVPAAGPTVVVQNVQMQNVAQPPPQPAITMPAAPFQTPYMPQPGYPVPPSYAQQSVPPQPTQPVAAAPAPQPTYAQQPVAAAPAPQPTYAQQPVAAAPAPQPTYAQQPVAAAPAPQPTYAQQPVAAAPAPQPTYAQQPVAAAPAPQPTYAQQPVAAAPAPQPTYAQQPAAPAPQPTYAQPEAPPPYEQQPYASSQLSAQPQLIVTASPVEASILGQPPTNGIETI